MPEEAAKALPLLDRALVLEPDYAGAHGFLAWCHEALFMRGGFSNENRDAAIRHARAAIANGRDDATALALGAFVISMVEHDRVAALQAFDRALAISPSSSFTLFFGAVAAAWAGAAERAIDWAERALRVSPFDRLCYLAHGAIAIGQFQFGGYEKAADAARLAVQSVPSFSWSTLCWPRRLPNSGGWKKPKWLYRKCWHWNLPSAPPDSALPPRLPPR
jgi:adenylate cyclase